MIGYCSELRMSNWLAKLCPKRFFAPAIGWMRLFEDTVFAGRACRCACTSSCINDTPRSVQAATPYGESSVARTTADHQERDTLEEDRSSDKGAGAAKPWCRRGDFSSIDNAAQHQAYRSSSSRPPRIDLSGLNADVLAGAGTQPGRAHDVQQEAELAAAEVPEEGQWTGCDGHGGQHWAVDSSRRLLVA